MINFSYAQDNQMHKEMWKEWEPIERDFPKTWDIDIIRPREEMVKVKGKLVA